MQHFVNHGDGWTCLHCQTKEPRPPAAPDTSARGRFFTEGEAEEREPRLSTGARARWRDHTRRILFCPRCRIEETVES